MILVYSVKSYCILKMSENKEENRIHLKILLQKKRKNATQAKKICDIYRHNTVSVRVVQSWFKHLQSRNFDVKDARSDRSITGKIDKIIEKVE